jgi:hypothetical protein
MPQTLPPPQSLPATPEVSPLLLQTLVWLLVPSLEVWGILIQTVRLLFF